MLSTQLLSYYRSLSQQRFTVVDVETTGRYAWQSRMTELSVLQATLTDGIQHHQTDLINPQTAIPLKIVKFTGITQNMVDAAPLAEHVLPNYLPLLNQGILTAHNLEFDYAFLQTEYARLGVQFSRPDTQQLCTVRLARLMLPDLPSRSLPNLVQHFQFQVDHSHRAAADTTACWFLLERLLTEILSENDPILLQRFARERIPLPMAAQLLNCSQVEARTQLTAVGVTAKFVGRGRSGTWIYRRGEVEQVVERLHEAGALPLLTTQTEGD